MWRGNWSLVRQGFWVFLRCCLLWLGRWPGLAPAGESLSFASPKESNQRKGDPLSATLRFAAGNLRCSRFAGSRRTRFAQTAASPCPRNAALLGAARGGGSGHRDARPSRPNGPSRCSARVKDPRLTRPHTPHTRTRRGALTLVPSGCAEERRRKRDKGRSCLSEASSADPRFLRAPQVARSEAEGHRQRGRLLLLTFLGETRKVSRPPGRDPANGLTKKRTLKKHQALNLFRVKANATQNATPA